MEQKTNPISDQEWRFSKREKLNKGNYAGLHAFPYNSEADEKIKLKLVEEESVTKWVWRRGQYRYGAQRRYIPCQIGCFDVVQEAGREWRRGLWTVWEEIDGKAEG